MVTQDEYYREVFENVHYRGALGGFSRLIHRKIEEGISHRDAYPMVLEIGGNQAEHFPFVRHDFDNYVCSDIQSRESGQTDSRITFTYADAQALPFPDNSFDRVLNACVLHHVPNAYQALQEIRRVCSGGGLVSIYIPFDPGMLYRYVRHVVSHLKQSRVARISLRETKELWAREHINHALGLMNNVREVFMNDSITARRWPFPWLSWNFNLFVVYQIRIEKTGS
jgi:SAM-dependent methyltransferase